MLVVEARHMGMCFGVRDALELMRALPEPQDVTVHGELVHNPVVIDELAERGFVQQRETARDLKPKTSQILITAHGVSNRRKEFFLKNDYRVHDTTCPLVKRAHKAALHYSGRGYFVVLIGRPGHVEVEGLRGDLAQHCVVSSAGDVCSYPFPKIAVVNQTTTRPDELKRLHREIKKQNEGREVVLVDTTCQPTKDRQEAVIELLDRVQALVVVGGPNSNNTKQLGLRAQEKGLPWWRVSRAEELREEWFRGIRIVGLSAGTSTTDETVREVARALRSLSAVRRPAS